MSLHCRYSETTDYCTQEQDWSDANRHPCVQSIDRAPSPQTPDANYDHAARSTNSELHAEVPDGQPDSHIGRVGHEQESLSEFSPLATKWGVKSKDTDELDATDNTTKPSDDTEIARGKAQKQRSQKLAFRSHRQQTQELLYCSEPSVYSPGEEDNMDQETQQNTQPVEYLRGKGASSMLTQQDEADILCFLHPSSLPAHKAVELVKASTPQHVHVNYEQEGVPNSAYDTQANDDSEGSDSDQSLPAAPSVRTSSPDIALRMSSVVRDRRMGFVFGRNSKKCDLLMAKDSMRLSSAHFRIYVNHSGVLMLEDMSKNGTYVDSHLLKSLKADPPNHGLPSTRMLSHGSIIELPVLLEKNEEWIRFIVLFPARNNGSTEYQSNLRNYIAWIKQEDRKAQIVRDAGGLVPPSRPMPFTPLRNTARDQSPPGSSIAAATGQTHYGMKWHGGDKYNVVGHIGQGAFAMVYKLSTVQHGVVYACKQIEKRRFIKDGQSGHKMHHEIRIMERISHPNIVEFVDFHETDRYMFIIMEYMSLGDLTVYTNSDMMMHEHMGQHVAAQTCKALDYLHGQNIAHRDIKPDNILVANHSPYVFKLSDFGLSKIVSSEDNMRTFCGTILYCAPEIYPGYERARAGVPIGKRGRHIQHPREETRPYYHSVDTWGIAAVLFHLLSGHPAWAGTTDDNGAVMLETIFSTPINWERLTLAGVSDLGIDFLKRMLQKDPADRATDKEVLAHPWIKQIVSGRPAGPKEVLDQDDLDEQDGSDNHADKDNENLPDASQLNINDKHVSYDLDGTYEVENDDTLQEDEDTRDYKRGRRLNEEPQPAEPGPAILPDGTLRHNMLHSSKQYPLQEPHCPRHVDAQTPRQANNRLFGEIPESALQSSGVLGQNVNKALDIGDSQMEDVKEYDDIESIDGRFPGLNYGDEEDDYNEEDHDSEEYYIRQNQNGEERKFWRDISERTAPAASAAVPIPGRMEGSVVGRSHLTSVEMNRLGPDGTSVLSGIPSDINAAAHPTNNATSQPQHKDPHAPNAPSLYGAEDLVDDLSMASRESRVSVASAQGSKAASPNPIARLDESPARPLSKRQNQHLESESQEGSFKRSKTDHPASQAIRPALSSQRLKDQYPEENDQASIQGPNGELSGESSSGGHAKTVEPSSFDDHEVSKMVSHGYRIRDDPDELFLAIEAFEEWKKANPHRVDPGRDRLVAACTAKRFTGPAPIIANTGPNLNTTVDPYVNLLPYDQETPITLGILTPIEGSIPTVSSITITNRLTTFGRDPNKNTFVHPGDPSTDNWERVGKNCIDLTFWYLNIEKEIDDRKLPTKWYENPNLVCLISTRTSRYILINGVKLTKAQSGWNYGELRTGDIITVVEPDREREAQHESETKSLSFSCQFFTGASKDPRSQDGSEPFEVKLELDEFYNSQQRICNGWGRQQAAKLRQRQIAQGRDPDAEAAAKRAAKRERLTLIREKEAQEEAVHAARVEAKRKAANGQTYQRSALDNPDEKPPPNPADSNNLRSHFRR